MQVDETRLNEFVGKMVGDMGAAMSAALIVMGDRLGLFQALADSEGLRSAELARRTGTTERNVREWLAGMAAADYLDYDPQTERYSLSPEQAMVFADESSPVFMPGLAQVIASMYRDEPKVSASFKTGKGFGWHEHDACLFHGTERFFRPGYAANLIASWLPALDGVVDKLSHGIDVADVGCGHGASTVIMAQAFPKSRFHGFDYHVPSIERARQVARDAGAAEQCRFEVGRAQDFPGTSYGLVAFFDCLHDMSDPVGAAKHVHGALAPDGTWMIVEPFAHDRLEDNFNPVGRVFYGASTMICTPASLSHDGRVGLGAQAGEARLREVVLAGGFKSLQRATETPFNMVLEARP